MPNCIAEVREFNSIFLDPGSSPNCFEWEHPLNGNAHLSEFIVKLGRCNLPPDGGKLHRLFHSSMPKFSVTPIHRKTLDKNMLIVTT
jgi:hypothetical protein